MFYFIVNSYNYQHKPYLSFIKTRKTEEETIFIDELQEISDFHRKSINKIQVSKDLILKNAVEILDNGKVRKVFPNTKKNLKEISLEYDEVGLKLLGETYGMDEELIPQSLIRICANGVVAAYNEELSRKETIKGSQRDVLFQILSFLFAENIKANNKIRQITLTTAEFLERADDYEHPILTYTSLSISESTLKSAIKFLENTGLVKVEISNTRPQKWTFTLHPQVYRIVFDSIHSFTEEDIKPQGFKDLFASHEHIARLYQNHYQ